jgi:hypothetical protein
MMLREKALYKSFKFSDKDVEATKLVYPMYFRSMIGWPQQRRRDNWLYRAAAVLHVRDGLNFNFVLKNLIKRCAKPVPIPQGTYEATIIGVDYMVHDSGMKLHGTATGRWSSSQPQFRDPLYGRNWRDATGKIAAVIRGEDLKPRSEQMQIDMNVDTVEVKFLDNLTISGRSTFYKYLSRIRDLQIGQYVIVPSSLTGLAIAQVVAIYPNRRGPNATQFVEGLADMREMERRKAEEQERKARFVTRANLKRRIQDLQNVMTNRREKLRQQLLDDACASDPSYLSTKEQLIGAINDHNVLAEIDGGSKIEL